jgi:plasmid maintenance system antidote protein VapI
MASQTELSNILGISDRQIRNLIKNKVLSINPDSSMDIAVCVQARTLGK